MRCTDGPLYVVDWRNREQAHVPPEGINILSKKKKNRNKKMEENGEIGA